MSRKSQPPQNDEARTKLKCPNDEKTHVRFFYHSDFVIRFVVRHSSFVIFLTPLSLQVASVFCAIWRSLFSLRRFVLGSSVKRKPDRLPWSAWALSSVFPQFLSRQPPLFLRSLPLALRGNRLCIFRDSTSSSCCRSVIWPCSSRVCRPRSFSGHAVSLDPRVHRRNALTREQARHL